MTREILKNSSPSSFDLILLPGFVQWNTSGLEKEFSVNIKKGSEFASDLPLILQNIDKINLSNKIPANKLFINSAEEEYERIVKEIIGIAQRNLGHNMFYINENKSNIIIGRNIPPPIIAEIVNCTEKKDKSIKRKAQHYINSGADIIDI